MKKSTLLIYHLLLIISVTYSQFCDPADQYKVSIDIYNENYQIQRDLFNELDGSQYHPQNLNINFYYRVPNELLGSLLFKFPWAVQGNGALGKSITFQYDGTYDIYLMSYDPTTFSATQLAQDGWQLFTPHSMVTSGAYGQPYSIYKKSTSQITTTPSIQYWFLGGIAVKNCQKNSACPDGQYRDIATNLCFNCQNSNCKKCNIISDRKKCTSCYNNFFLYLASDDCVPQPSCNQITTTSFYINTSQKEYIILDKIDEAYKVFQYTNNCQDYQNIVQFNLNLRQSCQQQLIDFVDDHKSKFLEIFLKGCDVLNIVNQFVPNPIVYPSKVCLVYGDPWMMQFDGYKHSCQETYTREKFFENQDILLEVRAVTLRPQATAIVEIHLTFKGNLIFTISSGNMPVSTIGFQNGVEIIINQNVANINFNGLPNTKVWIQQFSSFYLLGIDTPLNGANTQALCFQCLPSNRRILQSFTVTEQLECQSLDQTFKESCNHDVSALGSSWAQASQDAQSVYQEQLDFAVNNALVASGACPDGEYYDNSQCYPCPVQTCRKCENQNDRSECTRCPINKYKFNKKCIQDCPFSYYPNSQNINNPTCEQCSWMTTTVPMTYCQFDCCVIGTQNIQDGSNINPACHNDSGVFQRCQWYCPNQTHSSNGCNSDVTNTTTTCIKWTATPNYLGWQFFCDLYCVQGVYQCKKEAGVSQMCECSQYS